MAKISTYPIVSVPTVNDLLIGTDVENLNETKNFSIGDIASLIIGGAYVPYVGATGNVNLGSFSITASSFIVPGGLATQFVKADGTLDSTVYQPAGNYITQLSGEATASGPGNASVTLSNSAVINKVLTGLTITGSAIVSTDSILTAFGKVQNQINTLVGGVQYKGTWNAATNTPILQSSVGVQGNYYVVSVAGNTNLNGITDWNLGDWAIFNGSAWEKVDNTDAVISVNGQVGAVVLTTTNIAEGTNLYYTDLRARQAISLTTTGNSGASTYSYLTGVFNIPEYTLAGLGGVPLTRQLTINGTAFDLSADRSWSVGTVTSIATTGPLTGGTITGSGTIGITQASASSDGYLSSTDWTTFNNKQNAIINPVTGTGTPNTLPMWGSSSSLINSPLSYAADTFNFQYNSATGGTVNFTNIGLTAYTYSIQMNNFGSPRSTVHSYTDGLVIQSIGGTQVSRIFANGNLILGTGAVDNGYKLEITGSLFVNSIANATVDTDRFIVSDGGVIKYRTGAQILSDIGAVSSVGLTMPAAFTVSNSPITSAGTIAVTGAGNSSQYVRGDGTLADFPTSGGGGSSVSYYLNGSVSQGTISGVAYYEMSKVPILGAGTDFSINADGYIASFITDAGDPNLLEIPGGNWNFETYFSASSGGGIPTFYVELYKYNGTTFTLIASSSGTPELISFGTNIQPYFSTLAVPQTTLLATDRLAVRYYVAHSGRTITLHTEDNHLCQIITTFTTGLTALNGLTDQVQYFQVGTTGTDFNIVSSVDTHSFNLPTASAVNRGALSSADWTTFNNKQNALTNPVTGTGSVGQVAFWDGTSTQTGDNGLFWDNTNKRLGVGTNAPIGILNLAGSNTDHGTTGIPTIPTLLLSRATSSASNYAGLVITTAAASSNFGLYSNQNGALFYHGGTERWRITSTGVLQSNGLQTIQTSTGDLTLATAGGSGNIVLTPNGTGIALIQNTVVGNIASFLSNTANGQRLNILSTATGVKIGSEFNTGISGTFEIFASGGSSTLLFGTVSIERWRITNTGVLQSNGLQTIQTSTGNLTIATGGGNGNIVLTPNGTGNVGVGTTPSGAKLDVLGNFRVRRDINASQYLDITSGGGFVNLLAYNGNSSTIYQELIFQSGHTADTVERWRITSTGALQSNGAQTIQTSTGNLILTSADNTGIVDIQRNIRASGAELRLSNASNSSSWVAGDIVGTINFYLPNDTSTTQPIRSQIQSISAGGTTYPTSMNLTFSTANANTLTEGFRLTNLSNLLLGTQTDVASSIFTMASTTKGFLPPRMTAAQRTAIASPAEGLIVYQTDSVIGLYIYANATWRTLGMI